MIDNTEPSRHMARINPTICSHRFKMRETRPAFEWCADCSRQLLRQALPKRSGKTARKMAKDRK